jgi:hypothetical protein
VLLSKPGRPKTARKFDGARRSQGPRRPTRRERPRPRKRRILAAAWDGRNFAASLGQTDWNGKRSWRLEPAPGEVTVAWDAAWRLAPRLLPTYTGAIPASQRSPHETVTLVLDGQRNIGHGREFGCKTRLCFDMLRGRRALGKRAIDRVSTRSPCRSGSYRFGECSAGTRSPLSPLLRFTSHLLPSSGSRQFTPSPVARAGGCFS